MEKLLVRSYQLLAISFFDLISDINVKKIYPDLPTPELIITSKNYLCDRVIKLLNLVRSV